MTGQLPSSRWVSRMAQTSFSRVTSPETDSHGCPEPAGPHGTVDALLGDEAHGNPGRPAGSARPHGSRPYPLAVRARIRRSSRWSRSGSDGRSRPWPLHILHHGGVIRVRPGTSRPEQAQNRPLAADGAGDRGALGNDIVAGGLIDVLGVQLRQAVLGGQQHVIVAHRALELLGRGVRALGRPPRRRGRRGSRAGRWR